jgi:membrane protease YdiL (CAAX protease family)
MTSAGLVLAFPAITATGFFALFAGLRVIGATQWLSTRGFYVYAALLLLLLGAVAAIPAGRSRIAEGLSAVPGGWLAVPILLGAALAGVALFGAELLVAVRAARSRRAATPGAARLVEGGTERLRAAAPSAVTYSLLAVVVVAAEEALWRGVLLTALPDAGLPTAVAVAIGSVSYGLNHYHFGLRGIVAKTVHGLVWSLMFLASGSLAVPFVSHLAFEMAVGWQMVGGGKR